jgi:hypothetical protein
MMGGLYMAAAAMIIYKAYETMSELGGTETKDGKETFSYKDADGKLKITDKPTGGWK